MPQPSVRRSIWIVLAVAAVCVLLCHPVQRAYRDYERERLTRESNALMPLGQSSKLQMPAEGGTHTGSSYIIDNSQY